ncbi:hypothetical protein [uncultured Dubosiella sp.]|uniref:Cap15 family cyclic dinucleotide receptor domain-containing protein n=1 Tax=uncultured Dubosiella sp. TaxID=1937011 RepID=UPI0025B52C19|nr:hypothetical protein [uncultured Dubosiella sp.]
MEKRQNKLLKLGLWSALVLFIFRVYIGQNDIQDGFTLYDWYGYCGEAITAALFITFIYEKFFWRLNPFEKTPKLSKKYSGTIFSNYDDQKRVASLHIKQTFLTVHITLTTDESKSNSYIATIDEINNEPILTYCYLNHPKSEFRNRSEIHYGTATLCLSNPKELVGQYYTDRQTIGDMNFVASE